MGKRILVIQGHPDTGARHFCHALAAAYQGGAREAGHDVREIEVARLSFPLLGSQEEWERGDLPAGLEESHRAVAEADHLALFYPLWMGTMPALLKAFLEQVLRPDLCGGLDAGRPERPLRGTSARIVVTMGMPALAYRWFYRAHGVRNLERNILKFIGIRPVRTTLIGMVESMDHKRGDRLLAGMDKLGRLGR